MNKIVGFVRISKDAKTCKGAKNPSEFIGNVCRVVEFGHDDCVMVLNPESTALAMFDKEDVQQSFKCGYVNGVITPPNLDYISEIAYYTKAISRKGGYNNIISRMVIEVSLMKGAFNDSLLWQKQ